MAGAQRMKKGKAPWRNILVPVDGSAPSKRAAAQAASLARRLGAGLTLLHVITPFEAHVYGEVLPQVVTHADFERHAQRTSARILAGARRTAAGVACLCRTAWNVSASDAIAEAARRHHCDLVVMGSHGRRGLERLLLGASPRRCWPQAACR